MIPNRKGLFRKVGDSEIRNKAPEELKQHRYAVLRAFSEIRIVFGKLIPETAAKKR